MFKKYLKGISLGFTIMLLWSASLYSQEYVTWKTAPDTLTIAGGDRDTLFVNFSQSYEGISIATRASRLARRVTASGFNSLTFDRTIVDGTPDSMKVIYYPLHPETGALSKTDSSFGLGGASTYDSFLDGTDMSIDSLIVRGGFGIVLESGDVATDTVQVITHLHFGQ
jgi:hypothetical protein